MHVVGMYKALHPIAARVATADSQISDWKRAWMLRESMQRASESSSNNWLLGSRNELALAALTHA